MNKIESLLSRWLGKAFFSCGEGEVDLWFLFIMVIIILIMMILVLVPRKKDQKKSGVLYFLVILPLLLSSQISRAEAAGGFDLNEPAAEEAESQPLANPVDSHGVSGTAGPSYNSLIFSSLQDAQRGIFSTQCINKFFNIFMREPWYIKNEAIPSWEEMAQGEDKDFLKQQILAFLDHKFQEASGSSFSNLDLQMEELFKLKGQSYIYLEFRKSWLPRRGR